VVKKKVVAVSCRYGKNANTFSRSISVIVSELGHGFEQLKTINLRGCQSITDIGLSALANGCGQLQTIKPSRFRGITDISIKSVCTPRLFKIIIGRLLVLKFL
jgi:hypothetical protein